MTVERLADRRVLVMGLGRFGGGVGVTHWLCRQGARVTVTDLAEAATLTASLEQIADLPVELCLGGHDRVNLDQCDLVVVNPAVNRHRSGLFGQIVRRRIAWTTEINLFVERCPAKIIGVTGTVGKSTTCALLAEVLQSGGVARQVWFGGNVGRSLLLDLEEMRSKDLAVLELSSFQLDSTVEICWSPPIAAITSILPNHLDRHGSFEQYLDAKLNLFRFSDPVMLRWSAAAPEPISLTNWWVASPSKHKPMIPVSLPSEPYELRIVGAHQQENAAAAATIASLLGVDDVPVRRHLAAFAGLPHRLEHVGCFDGVDYFNDSKATTPQGAVTALAAFDRPVIVLVGGQDRGDELGLLVEALDQRAKAVICLGEFGRRLASTLPSASCGDHPPVQVVGDLTEAVEQARQLARPGDVVLLSPAAPSYDRFLNYEQRGQAFVDLARGSGGD